MILNIISIIIIILCITAISYLVGRRLRIVASINVEALPQEREASVRKRILQERFSRTTHEWVLRFFQIMSPLITALSRYLRRSYEKLREIKESYPQAKQELRASGQDDRVTPKDLISRGYESVKEEQYYDAEQDFIEAIKLNPRRIEPYQGLARIYLEQKEFTQAEATLKHLLRLLGRSNVEHDAIATKEALRTEVLYDLWEVCILQERTEEALSWILKAVALESNNPRFLDSLTATYIALGQRLYAERALDKLRTANPDNKKIEEFFEQIKALSY
ncbi:tetratricopeptide repeat protein [Candidatus Uhrbacteria bacterium]|nr:tetratricopeptide repeat protein [Candidatus Uhrbacteria bacterium]